MACHQLGINCSPLASLDPAVYPGPVRHLGRGEEEGATANPGLKSSRGSRTFQDREGREEVAGDLVIQSAQSSSLEHTPHPPSCLSAGEIPVFHIRPQPSPSLKTLNVIRILFLSSLSFWWFIHGEEGTLKEEPPKALPLKAGQLGCSGLMSPRLCYLRRKGPHGNIQWSEDIGPFSSATSIFFLKLVFPVGVQKLTKNLKAAFRVRAAKG